MGGVTTWLAVAVGGALGSLGRFWLGAAVGVFAGPRFPWGTLLINILGSFVIGLVTALAIQPARVPMHPDVLVFLVVGVCGGFTTFSAFSLQTLQLMQGGDMLAAAGYIVGSVVLCLTAVWLGVLVGRP
jgi:CrcB protein